MGNAAAALSGRSDDENVAVMKVLLEKYERLKRLSGVSQRGSLPVRNARGSSLSDLQLFYELKRELENALCTGVSAEPSIINRAAIGDTRKSAYNQTGSKDQDLTSTVTSENFATARTSSSGGGDTSTRREVALTSKTGSASAALRPPSILVVDDSPISCKLARRAMARLNFQVEVALDGRQGLDILQKKPTDFDLVVLDIVMPILDGIQVLRDLKSNPQLSSIPVAMLSGMQDETLDDCIQQGAVVVLRKPMKVDDVLRVLREHCPHTRVPSAEEIAKMPAPVPRGTATPRPPPTAVTWSPGQQPRPPPSGAPVFAAGTGGGGGGMGSGGTPRRQQTSPGRGVKVSEDREAPDFELLDEKQQPFRLQEVLARHPDRKLLLAFIPAAFAESAAVLQDDRSALTSSASLSGVRGEGGNSSTILRTSPGAAPPPDGLLSSLMAHLPGIKATNTAVVGVGKDLPFTLAALSANEGIEFPLLSDPFLHVSDDFIGTFDLGVCFPYMFGRTQPVQTTHRAAHAGIVVLNGQGKCLYRWASMDGVGNPVLPTTIDFPELMTVLEAPSRDRVSGSPQPMRTERTSSEVERTDSNPSGSDTTGTEDGRLSQSDMTSVEDGRNSQRGLNSGRKVSILIVDDSAISCKLAMRKLRALGYATMHAENGQSALDILRRRSSRVNLVLLDVVMPVMDGVQLLNVIKTDRDLNHIPVVMLSGLERAQLGNTCVEAGALAVLQKPLKAREVQDLIVREGL